MVIQIDGAALSTIYAAGQTVTLARFVQSFVQTLAVTNMVTPPPAVAWQAFQPVESNTIDWADQYYCFASTVPLNLGTVLTINARCPSPMQAGVIYAFANGQFTPQPASGSDFVIANDTQSGSYVFGLAQSATINTLPVLAPCCAVPILCGEAAYFVPSELISIFLSSAASGGTVIPPEANAYSVLASAGQTGPTIGFDDQSNVFFQIS